MIFVFQWSLFALRITMMWAFSTQRGSCLVADNIVNRGFLVSQSFNDYFQFLINGCHDWFRTRIINFTCGLQNVFFKFVSFFIWVSAYNCKCLWLIAFHAEEESFHILFWVSSSFHINRKCLLFLEKPRVPCGELFLFVTFHFITCNKHYVI